MNREQMENWLTLEGWQAYNHAEDQSWDQWGFSKNGVHCMFRYFTNNEANARMAQADVGADEVPFPLDRVPDADLFMMYAWATTGEPS